jgi:hypothetical protein
MRLSYHTLIQVHLRHTFYREGLSKADFRVSPTADTRDLLDARGLLFKAEADSFGVYAEIEPDSVPPTLKRAIGSENLCLRFLLEPLHGYLFNISQLDPYHLGRELFCFDNLTDDQADERLYLGDSVAGARLGAPVRLQTSRIVDYRFDTPVNSAQLNLFDRFDNQLDSHAVESPDGQGPLSGYRYDLDKVSGVRSGRYRLQDDQGGELAFYYDPQQFGRQVFGVVELFNRTERLTPTQTDLVPTAYRWLDGDQLVASEAFTLQLESRATLWRYIVTKRYDNNSIDLAQVSVNGPVSFDRADEAQRVIFTAQDPLPLAETQQTISLTHDGTEIRSLPNPSLTSPLEGTVDEGIQYSDVFVYV